jgi:hypothetical protein
VKVIVIVSRSPAQITKPNTADLLEARRRAADIARETATLRADAAWKNAYSATSQQVYDETLPRDGCRRMSRRPAQITQADIDRAIRAVKKAGLTSYEIAIEGPRVVIRVPGRPLAPDEPVAETREIVL